MSSEPKLTVFMNDNTTKEKVFIENSDEKRYIILMNDTLHAEVRKLTKEKTELQQEIEELQEDDARHSNTNNNIKGLLKNLNEMNQIKDQVVKLQKEIIQKNEKEMHSFRMKGLKHVRIFESIFIVFLGLCFQSYDILTTMVFICVAIYSISFIESYRLNIPKNLKITEYVNIRNLEDEIKEIDQAQTYIHELIELY